MRSALLLALITVTPLTAQAMPLDGLSIDEALAQHSRLLSEADRDIVARSVEQHAMANGLDLELVLGVIQVESSFKRRQRSGAGAMGLMQVMPKTGAYVAKKARLSWDGDRTLYDPARNIEIGTIYLARLIRYFKGDVDLALTAYCHGPGLVKRWVREGTLTERRLRYSRKVAAARARYKGVQPKTFELADFEALVITLPARV